MGNICSENKIRYQCVKKKITGVNMEQLENPVSTNIKTEDIYTIYSNIYKDYDIYTAKELFQDSVVNICRFIDIYDGDTCKIALQPIKNNYTVYKFSIRLNGVDTPEIRTSNGEEKIAAIKARNRLISLIIEGGKSDTEKRNIIINETTTSKDIKRIMTDDIYLAKIKTQGFDKYGRLLVEIFPYNDSGNTMSYNQVLINEKFAYEYNGGTKQKFQ